jgi:hypothetical protein
MTRARCAKERLGVVPIDESGLRTEGSATVAKLIRSGADARLLYHLAQRVVVGLKGCFEIRDCEWREAFAATDHLGALLSSWERHDCSGGDQTKIDYWQAVVDLCDRIHDLITDPLDCLPLGHVEVHLGAIRDAAFTRLKAAQGE